jgi:hypothetical protein
MSRPMYVAQSFSSLELAQRVDQYRPPSPWIPLSSFSDGTDNGGESHFMHTYRPNTNSTSSTAGPAWGSAGAGPCSASSPALPSSSRSMRTGRRAGEMGPELLRRFRGRGERGTDAFALRSSSSAVIVSGLSSWDASASARDDTRTGLT